MFTDHSDGVARGPQDEGDEALKSAIMQRAATLIRSQQDVPEWPGGYFLRPPKDERATVLDDLVKRLKERLDHLEIDQSRGVIIDGLPLPQQALRHIGDPPATNSESARIRGFFTGCHEAFDWMGITRTKWSSLSPEVCALETLAAAEGIPTSRQANHRYPRSLIGAKVDPVGAMMHSFHHGEINGIRTRDGKPGYLRHAEPQFANDLSLGYRDGVETAFLHFMAGGDSTVRIHPIEVLSEISK